ncbi:MAG: bifunctional nuclease family protein, partial [Candidatus Rokubacteria bacterium]|nr:bifunctional nuclease family protein [Candidatus Rokubacteria bacterium]
VTPPRPLTHDLFLTMFGRLKVTVTKVVITDLRDNTYFAVVHLAADGGPMELDARPSDGIALAIRAGAPVYVERRVFDKSEPRREDPSGPGPRI